MDLGSRYEIRTIATQGRTNTNEFVTEYVLQYSDDGQAWKTFINSEGDIEMFQGNTDGKSVHRNEFEIPIIAQWIRINPTRWNERISLRVELYGCDYVSDHLYLNGSSLLVWNLLREPIAATREAIKFRFKTSHANGVLLYSRGTQGDYIALQLRDNRLVLNINLGSGMMTSFSVGSLLDDNIWHDVVISRNRKDIIFSVDRVLIKGRVKGEFVRLNLNREFYVGGVPNKQEGLIVYQNFTGCIENFYINSTNLIREIREAYESEYTPYRYQKINAIEACPEPPIVPVTFLTAESFARLKGYEGVNSLNVSFAFRSYEENGLLMFHKFTSPGYIKLYLQKGRIKGDVQTGNNPLTVLDNFEETFNDGRWHQVILTVRENNIVLDVDNRPMKTTRLLKMTTGSQYRIGGGDPTHPGFIGCMRMISIDGNYRVPSDWRDDEYCCKGEILRDSCHMIDRCNPNPCKHNGECKQDSKEFFCDCTGTGYAGSVCHTSTNPLSCEAYKNVNSVGQKADIKIDIDGSGPLKPFPVTCEFFSDGRVDTVIHHSNEKTTPVDGFQEPGSFVQEITYDADMDQIEAFMNRSTSCRQRLHYKCKNSRLMNSPSSENDFRPFAWWVSRWNQKMDYWGGALPGSRKCECGVLGKCNEFTKPAKWCNCDAGFDGWAEDGGDITQMEHLPVKQVHFGDTGNPLDEKEGRYTLGPLICTGDNLFSNVVTFRIADSSINLPTFDMGHSGDIYFEFKTTAKDAVILHSTGPTDYIRVSIITGNRVQFEYQAGSGTLGVAVDTAYRLDDDNWHSISIERNRKGGRLIVDGSSKNEVHEPTGPVRALHLTSDLVIGSSVDYRDGFVGCIRALLLNGELADLKGHAMKGLYGVSVGCVGKCESNPCLNNGTCIEGYDGYTCDCRWTAFKGPICADEIGVILRPDSLVKYDFMGSWRSTIAENIRVGFTTTRPQGFLLGFFSNISKEYLTIMISNSGHLRVVFDFGFERQELIFPNKQFDLGQYHDVRIRRKNSGSTLVIEVDSYEPKEYHFNIKASADAQFNNIQYMYIGKNESMAEGFVGCVSRVEFDDIYPLKLLFQENGPSNVKYIGSAVIEDFCGVEPVTHPPDVHETRPPPILDEDQLRAAYSQTDSAIIGGVLGVLFVVLIIMAILFGRYVARHKGEYITQEDKGADAALDPDSAAVRSRTGHPVNKRKEWFI
ncbi:UNVERIFIED_CONTAM: hypothetical protein PYX00_008294 [Menopon gallinae]|uniref:Neurexin-4 n=1 Tax=Menopon gallinae TaxID=328185 RepID=A0AAW2HMP1_9NEOP